MKHNKSIAFAAESTQKCRCCKFPSTRLLKLESVCKPCGAGKTYKDVLYDIANIKVSQTQEEFLTQKVCKKCCTQLNNCYKFIIQAREVCEQYLLAVTDLSTQNDTKGFEDIPESLVELPIDFIPIEKSTLITRKSPIAINSDFKMAIEIKSDPTILECTGNIDEPMTIDKLQVSEIKEEKPESMEENTESKYNENDKSSTLTKEQEQKYLTNDLIYGKQKDHYVNFSSDSEDDVKDAEDPITEDDFYKNLSKEPTAMSCDICHKIFKDKLALKTHKLYTHMPDDKKRSCPMCSFKSSRSYNLKIHIGMVHGAAKAKEIFKPANNKYPCSICHQSFRHKDTLQNHIKRIHQNPQPKEPRKKPKLSKQKERFLCTYCGISFGTKYCLGRHVVIHTDERTFAREICQKIFQHPKDLHMHCITHR